MHPTNPVKTTMLWWLMMCMSMFTVAAQQDPLKNLAEGSPDSVKVNLLLQLSNELQSSQPAQSFEYAKKALDMAEESNDEYHYGLACRSVAGVYTLTGIYDRALEYLYKALSTFEILGDSSELADCYDALGQVYMLSGDFTNAHDNFRRSLALNVRLADHTRITKNYMNMGSNYIRVDSIDKGLSYLVVSLMIADSLNMKIQKAELLKLIGNGYAKMGQDEEALQHFYKVLELIGDDKDDITRCDAMVCIARGYLHMRNYNAALKYAVDARELAHNRNFAFIYRDAVQILSEIYAGQGNYQLAFKYGKEYQVAADSIMNLERSAQLAKIQTLYELNSIEEENARLLRENLNNQRRVRIRTLLISINSIMLVMMVVLVIALNRLNNKYKITNRQLSLQSDELEALNDLKDNFFSFVAHNLKNPFNTIVGFAGLMNRAADERDVNKARQYAGLIAGLSSQVQKVLSNLLEWSRLQRRSFEYRPEKLEINSLIRDVAEMNNKEAARKDINLGIHSRGRVYVTADRSMITTVLQNLVANAVQFTPDGGRVSIECRKKETWAEISVTDTGIGIPDDKLTRLFQFDFVQGKVGRADTGGSGMGLIICHEILVKNGGTIAVNSTPGKGSKFTFTLPLAIREDNDTDAAEQGGKLSSVQLAEELLLSQEKVAEDARTAIIERIVPHYSEVSRVLSLENLDIFSKAIIETGEKYGLTALANFGKSLAHLTRTHQIDLIIPVLPKFKEYLKIIDNAI